MGKQGCESIFLKNSKIQADTLTLERSILMNTLSNDANANCLLIFILVRLINQLRLYNLIEYSLRYDNNKTGNLIHVFENNKSGYAYFRALYLNEYCFK